MKKAAGIAVAALAFALTACTSSGGDDGPSGVSQSVYAEVEWVTDPPEPPDPEAILARAAIEGSLDGQPFELIEFTKICKRSGDGDRVTFDAETRGYGYNDYNTGEGVGNFRIELVGVSTGSPTVKGVWITHSTGPDAVATVYVSGPADQNGAEPVVGQAAAVTVAPNTYTITGSAPDLVDSTRTTTFTTNAACLQPLP
ncbi:MAG: hypothetical protein C0482_00995 [Gordonia sp.]|nr:hypothetical protein [Gordonia sp. (in: high G+C Gram-positive bacteria)]